MRSFLAELQKKILLHDEDVSKIRDYVQKKLARDDARLRATVLADAIHRVLDRHMQCFEGETRAQIRKKLIERAVIQNHFTIDAGQLFQVTLTLDKEEKNQRKGILESLWYFVNHDQGLTLSMDTLQEFAQLISKQAQGKDDHFWEEIFDAWEVKQKPDSVQNVDRVSSDEPLIPKALKQDLDIYFGQNGFEKASVKSSNIITRKVTREMLPPGIKEPVTSPLAPPKISLSSKVVSFLGESEKGSERRSKSKVLLATAAVAIVASFVLVPVILGSPGFTLTSWAEKDGEKALNPVVRNSSQKPQNELPDILRYHPVNVEALRQWLQQKNSLLADEPYLSTIINISKEYDIHPFLMIAITGQEQAFVPRNVDNARKIANNPFNVYHSWQDYNTDINDSARIAAVTIINLSKDRPVKADPIAWINTRYSEDNRWFIGVEAIFTQLVDEAKGPQG
ncbi:hypothetical protein H1S01_19605 [Heliobacterium chlorum]|uniref:Mannosyl-glycoprotein endo-beta-N-acetylglucosamidase-like domain-containing protein n=1 Tax=Heliobacterium chlorum TaxID=2698 RepID=A0ABR7TA17_HELCL|nr:hypothetical protein [Heliobacterium chlorum]MBC9786651.1 hypothetical protein [Heliobacterium chlorum]